MVKIPWRRKWQPTPVFLPRDFHGQGSYNSWGCKESDMTEQLTLQVSLSGKFHEHDGLQSMQLGRVRHDRVCTQTSPKYLVRKVNGRYISFLIFLFTFSPSPERPSPPHLFPYVVFFSISRFKLSTVLHSLTLLFYPNAAVIPGSSLFLRLALSTNSKEVLPSLTQGVGLLKGDFFSGSLEVLGVG